MFDREQFLADLATFVGFKTIVCQNPDEFRKANAWIKGFFDPEKTEIIEIDCHGLTSMIIKPSDSERPNVLGDGHIEVVPGDDELFEMVEKEGIVYGRGVADMKTQCLAMMYALRQLLEEGRHNDFWIVFSEDEEVGSKHGVAVVVDYLCERGWFPNVVFAPDGGPDFAYVEKEKGILSFEAKVIGGAAHASRPYLGSNAIDLMMAFYAELKQRYPNPKREEDWRASLSMTTIAAGEAFNQIPDSAVAGFDVRLTEEHDAGEFADEMVEIGGWFGAEIEFKQIDPAVYYPREAAVARKYLEILRRVSGKEPPILHSAGASNGRLYVAKKRDLHVLMSSPPMGGSHAVGECLDASALEAFYRLVLETALLDPEEPTG